MDTAWLNELAAALSADDDVLLTTRVQNLLGAGASVTTWRPSREGWEHADGATRALPATVPDERTTLRDGDAVVIRAGADSTASRLVRLEAPAIEPLALGAVAGLVRTALDRLMEREAATGVQRRLADTERIGDLGSYDWHVPTDTNRWSDQLYRIYGEEPQSFNASYERFIGFIHPDDREKVKAIHQVAFATGEPYEMEERIVLADGTERLLWSNGEIIPGPDGSPEHFIGICRDVTEQRAADAAATRAEEQRQAIHDAELRRRAALELNDVVVQGLTSAIWSTDMGEPDLARQVLDKTLEDARRMMDDLLVGPGRNAPGPGELRRTAAPSPQLREGTASRLASVVSPPTVPAASGLRIVIADDAPDVRFLLGMQFRLDGYDVVAEAADGREAVTLCAEHDPDVVILDLSMPVMDGLEAAATIRASHPKARIVIVSGHAIGTMKGPAMDAGADGYVEKGKDIVERIVSCLGLTAA